MSFDQKKFNEPVYLQILGLGEKEPIEDWYGLLGVAQFEANPDLIDVAMAKRYQAARQYQVGTYEDQALELIDELSRAYACLTNDDDRAQYDATLRGETPAEPVVGTVVEPAEAEQPADPNTCPQCGKPTPPKASSCYQCGYRKPAESKPRSGSGSVSGQLNAFRDLAKQDLSPEQLVGRLRLARKLMQANRLASGYWRQPKRLSRPPRTEPRTRCHRCGRGLLLLSEAHALPEAEVRQTLEYYETFAKQLESLGKATFNWPLDKQELRKVHRLLPKTTPSSALVYCQACASRLIRGKRIIGSKSQQ